MNENDYSHITIWLLMMAVAFGIYLSSSHVTKLEELQNVLDKRITGNALMSDQAFNEASKAIGKAEENSEKIQEILERMKGQP